MFGRRNLTAVAVGGDTYRSHTTINQQPHDAADAARLYGEIEKKAEDKIASVVAEQLPNIEVGYVRMDMQRSMLDMSDRMKVIFRLNGRPQEAIITIPMYDTTGHPDPRRRAALAIAEAITKEVMDQMIPDLIRAETYGAFR